MWLAGDVMADILEYNKAWGLDRFDRPVPGGYTDRLLKRSVEPTKEQSQSVFPLITVCEEDIKIKCENSYNITLTDEQFKQFLDVIKSFKR